MAISLRGTKTPSFSFGGSITLAVPTGTTAGDVLYAPVFLQDSDTLVAPTAKAWTLVAGPNDVNSENNYLYRRVVQAGDPSSYTWVDSTPSGSGQFDVGYIAWTGVDNTTPEDVTVTVSDTVGTSLTMASITTVTANAQVWWTVGGFGSAATLSATGITQDLNASNGHLWALHKNALTASPATVNQTITSSVSQGQVAVMTIALRPAGSAFTGTAALSGSGTLAAAGVPAVPSAPSFGGSGTLAASSTPHPTASAGFGGAGSLAAGGTPAVNGTAALSGSGTLGSAAFPAIPATAALSGTGTLASTGTPSTTSSAAMSGAGTLSAAGKPAISGAAGFSGSGSLAAAGSPATSGLVTLGGSGTLTAMGTPAAPGIAAFSGTGTLGTSGSAGTVGLAILSGAGTLAALGAGPVIGTAAFGGAGVLAATVTLGPPGDQPACAHARDFQTTLAANSDRLVTAAANSDRQTTYATATAKGPCP